MNRRDNLARLNHVPVVAFEEGVQLGKVHDVYIDRQAKRMQGLSFKSRLYGKEGEAYVGLSEILKIGVDVIIVTRRAAAVPLTDKMAGHSLRHLKGFKITTRDGAYIGEMADLNVNQENGFISEIILKDNQRLEVDIEEIALGLDVIVVPTAYVDRLLPLEIERKGLLDRLFGPSPTAVTESLREKYTEIKASVGSTKGADKMVETLRSGSERTRHAVKRTSRKLQEAIEQIRSKHAPRGASPAEEDDGYQGAEAEHAGRTYTEPEHGDLPPTGEQGPYASQVRTADATRASDHSP